MRKPEVTVREGKYQCNNNKIEKLRGKNSGIKYNLRGVKHLQRRTKEFGVIQNKYTVMVETDM